MRKNLNYNPETRKVKSLVLEAIEETLIQLDYEAVALKAEAILNKLSHKKDFGPYLNRDVVKPEQVDAITKRKKYTERVNRLKSEILGQIDVNDFRVFKVVCDSLGLDIKLIRTSFKQGDYADGRKMIAYIFNRYFKYGVSKTGIIMNKDHSTIIHAVRKHKDYMDTDKQYSRKFYGIMSKIREQLSDILETSNSEEEAYLKTLMNKK
jgi:hypothetical protein